MNDDITQPTSYQQSRLESRSLLAGLVPIYPRGKARSFIYRHDKLILFTIVAFVIIGWIVYSNLQQSKSSISSSSTENTPKFISAEQESQSVSSVSDSLRPKYIEYSQPSLDEFVERRRVLFFYANWCPTCRSADASFTENESRIPDDVMVIRVNYNDPETSEDEKTLAQKYGVTYQHTFVQLDSEGNEVIKWNGGNIDELLENIK